jgi:putative glutamine amidotransferase
VSERHKPLIGLPARWEDREPGDWQKSRWYLQPTYFEALVAAGALPVMVPLIPEAVREIFPRLDGVLLTGSDSDVDPALYGAARHPAVEYLLPERDKTDFALLEEADRARKPVLGICFGMQSMNVYYGGSLIQHIPEAVQTDIQHSEHSTRHPITFEPGSVLAELGGPGPHTVNSTHHQAVDRVARKFRVTAHAPDGVIEGMEANPNGRFLMAVQWHPERIFDQSPPSLALLRRFVEACR